MTYKGDSLKRLSRSRQFFFDKNISNKNWILLEQVTIRVHVVGLQTHG